MAYGQYVYNVGNAPVAKSNIGQSAAFLRSIPTSPYVQNSIKEIEAYRRANPIYIPFAAGTPTQSRREMIQQQRQWEDKYELALRQQAEEETQNRIANQIAMAKLSSGSSSYSGEDGYSTPKTLSERKSLATAVLTESAINRYKNNIKEKFKYPLYYTINSLLSDPEWIKLSTFLGADRKAAIDNLLRSEGFSPDEYFNTPLLSA